MTSLKIKIEVAGQTLELSPEEFDKLFTAMEKLKGEARGIGILPVPYPVYPIYPPIVLVPSIPPWKTWREPPEITWRDSTTAAPQLYETKITCESLQ